MKITNIEIVRLSVPFETGGPRTGMRPGLDAWRKMESLLVRVDTDDGCSGWGEAFGHFVNPGTLTVLQSLVGPWFLGKNVDAIAATMEQAQRTFYGFGRSGPVVYALSAIEIALWDIAGQRANEPLYRLLGGSNNEVRLYASLVRYNDDAEAIAQNAQRAEAHGFSLIKLHESTVAAFMAAREATQDSTKIALDVGCPWSVREARAVARLIRDRGFAWLEEPIWPPEDFSALAAVRREGVPIAAGENISTLHDFRRAFEAGALDIVQPSVTKVGGIGPMREIFNLAKAFSVEVIPHCFYWGPGYLATAHLLASMPRPAPLETAFVTLERSPNPMFSADKSVLKLSENVGGLGFVVDQSMLDTYGVQRCSVKSQ